MKAKRLTVGEIRSTLNTPIERFRSFAQRGCGAGLLALIVLALIAAPKTQGGQRPIEEFLEAQGTYVIPGLEDWPAWTFFYGWLSRDVPYVFAMDYAGVASRWLEENSVSVGTRFNGVVNERELPDGNTEVTVVLQTRNALVWVTATQGDPRETELVFGYRPDEVLAGLPPVLGDCTFHVVFINHAPPGSPLPDLESPEAELLFMTIAGQARGPLRGPFGVPDGTPGLTSYASPAGKLIIKPVGK